MSRKLETKDLAAKELLEIASELTSEKYKGVMFPINTLGNFYASPKMNGNVYAMRPNVTQYGFSHIPSFTLNEQPKYSIAVNAGTFFSLTLENMYWSKNRVEGQDVYVVIEDGWRDPTVQQQKHDEYQLKCDRDPTLRRDQFVNPRVKPSSHMTGSAVDKRHAGKIYVKDLIKKRFDPYTAGADAYIPQEEQMRIKWNYFRKFRDASWKPDMALNMHQSSHIALLRDGKADPNAIYALANNRIQMAMDMALPFMTITNDEGFHVQLRKFFSTNLKGKQYDISFDYPIMYPSDFAAQDLKKVESLADDILAMAAMVEDMPIYYQNTLVPGRRIDFWNEHSKGHNTPLGDKGIIEKRIKAILKDRDTALARLNTGR